MKVQLMKEIQMRKDTELDGVCERFVQIDKNNTKHRKNSYKESKEIARKNKLPVTVVLEDSVVKDVRGWKLFDKNNKVVVKQ